MALRVAAWNVEGRLERRPGESHGSPLRILTGIERLNADLIVLPEAYFRSVDPIVEQRLQQWGYVWEDIAYNDNATRTTGPYLRIITRLPLANIHTVRFGNMRSLLCLRVVDPASQCQVRIIAVHLDGRSEKRRMRQVEDLITHVACEPLRTIVLGDFNAVWPEGYAKVLTSGFARAVIRSMPTKRLRSACRRFTDMALGTTLMTLTQATDLRDVDRLHVPTAIPRTRYTPLLRHVRLAQLDHILLTPGLVATDFDIAEASGSGHRAISATVHVRPKPSAP